MYKEVNIKKLEFISDSSKILIKKIKPNYKSLGAIFKNNTQFIANSILEMSQDEIKILETKKKFCQLEIKINYKK